MTTFTAHQLANPAIGQAALAVVVSKQPELWTAVLAHPNCYPELAQYIRHYLPAIGVPQVQPVAFTAAVPGVAAAAPVPSSACAPSPAAQPGNAAVEQMSAGIQQLASGAKEFLTHTVAPSAKQAGVSLQQAVNERREASPGANPIKTWAPIALPVLAAISLFSLFLPVVTVSAFGFSQTANFFDDEAEGGGVMLLVCLLIAIVPAVIALIAGKRWAHITAGVTGTLVGLLGAIIGFGTLSEISKLGEASAGAGVILLSFSAAAMTVAATVTLFTKNK